MLNSEKIKPVVACALSTYAWLKAVNWSVDKFLKTHWKVALKAILDFVMLNQYHQAALKEN